VSDLCIPDVVVAVQADIQAHGFPTTKVLYGDWQPAKHTGANHVIFGLGDFEFLDPLGPGPYFQDPVAKPSQARAIYSRVQACPVWVYAAPPVPQTDPKRAEKSQVATTALLHATVAALWRAATGSLSFEKGAWPHPESQQFVYGSLATFVAKLWIPVLDAAAPFVQPNVAASSSETYTVVGGIQYRVAKTP
jgi:hypothetical protein